MTRPLLIYLIIVGLIAIYPSSGTANPPSEIGTGFFKQIDAMDTQPSAGLIVTAEHSGRVVLWNGKTLKCIGELGDVENGPPVLVRFIPARDAVVYVDNSGHLRTWLVSSRVLIRRTLVTGQYVNGADISADGSMLLVSTFKGHDIYNIGGAATLTRHFPADKHGQDRARFTPDGRNVLIVSSEGLSRLLNVETGREVRKYQLPFQAVALAFSPDGRLFATGTYGGKVDLWDVSIGKKIRSFAGEGLKHRYPGDTASKVFSVVFSPDGTRLAAARGSTAVVWDVRNGKENDTWSGLGRMAGVGFLDAETKLAAAGLKTLIVGHLSAKSAAGF